MMKCVFQSKPLLMDPCLIRTPHNYGLFALFLRKESPYMHIFSKFNQLNMDTFYGLSASVLTGFDCILRDFVYLIIHRTKVH